MKLIIFRMMIVITILLIIITYDYVHYEYAPYISPYDSIRACYLL